MRRTELRVEHGLQQPGMLVLRTVADRDGGAQKQLLVTLVVLNELLLWKKKVTVVRPWLL